MSNTEVNPVEVITNSIESINKSLEANVQANAKMLEMQNAQAEIKKSKEESDLELSKKVEEIKSELSKSYDEKLEANKLEMEELKKSMKKPAFATASDVTPIEVIEKQLQKSYIASLRENQKGIADRLCKDEEYIKKSIEVLRNEVKVNKNSAIAAFSDQLFSDNICKSIHNSTDSSLGGLLANAPLLLPIQRQVIPMSPIKSLATTRLMNSREAQMAIIDNYGTALFAAPNDRAYSKVEETVANISKKMVSAVECYFGFTVHQDFFKEIDNNIYGLSYFNEILNVASQQIQVKLNQAYINGDTIGNGAVIEGLIPEASKTFEVVKSFDYEIDKIGYVKSGDATLLTKDTLIKLKRSLPSTLQNKVFIMNSETLAQIEVLKDDNGRYLFSYNTKEGFTNGMIEGMILGIPVVIDDTMPDIAANSFPIVYGNIAQSFTIIDGWNSSQELLTRDANGESKVDKYIVRMFSTAMRTGFQSYRLYKIAA